MTEFAIQKIWMLCKFAENANVVVSVKVNAKAQEKDCFQDSDLNS